MPFLPILVGLLLQTPGAGPGDPRALLDELQRAVRLDSVPVVEARWARVLARDPGDRVAMLALGALARATYRHETADTLLSRLSRLGPRDVLTDLAHLESGKSLLVRGHLEEASDAFSLAVRGAEEHGDSVVLGMALLGLSLPRSRLDPPPKVLALLDRAGALIRGDPGLEANALCQRAALLVRLGHPEARPTAEAGAARARDAADPRQEGACAQVLAQFFAASGDLGGALEAIDGAIPLFQQARDHAALASALQWQGYVHNSLGLYGKAREDLTAAIREGEIARAMSPVGWSLINLGMISLGLGDRITATAQLRRARDLLESQGDLWGGTTARSMLGGVLRAEGDVPGAREAYEASLAWADEAGNVQVRFNMHEALASLAEMTGDWTLAEREYGIAGDIARQTGMTGYLDGLRFNLGRMALRRGDLAKASRELGAYLVVAGTAQHSIRYATRALLAEVSARQGDLATAEAEVVAAGNELDAWRASLSQHDQRVRAAEVGDGIDPDLGIATVIAALAEGGRVRAAFEVSEARRARELEDGIYRAQTILPAGGGQPLPSTHERVDADTLQALLDGSTALLEYVTGRGGEPTTLFVLTSAGITSLQLQPIDSMDGDISRFTTIIEAGGDVQPLGRRLGRALLQPAVDALDPRITKLIMVPEDAISRVPFDALVLADGRFALERFAISVVPAATTLLALRRRVQAEGPVRLLVFGGPRFAGYQEEPGLEQGTDPATALYASAFEAQGGLPPLPGSRREAMAVARFAVDPEVRLGDDASEAYLRQAPLDSFRVIHFATHALVDDYAATRTALALSPGGDQDGFLGPADLAALRLRADLVVLSACRTAGGVVLRGEGIQGLTAPLLQAGARSVVATAWRVADAGAGKMMEAMYSGLAAGEEVGEALHEAKLQSLRRGEGPWEWAAFVAIGDPSTRIPLTRPTRRPWVVLFLLPGSLALVSGAYFWTRRKRTGSERSVVPSSMRARTTQL